MTEAEAIINAPNHGERVRLAVESLGGVEKANGAQVLDFIERAGVKITRQTVWARLNEMRDKMKPSKPAEAESREPEEPEKPEQPNEENEPQTAAQAASEAKPEEKPESEKGRVHTWPLFFIMLSALVAVWSGWVGLGEMVGFGPVNLLPGMGKGLTINTAITLPLGMEFYGGYALYVWLSGKAAKRAETFAKISALIALAIGGSGQIVYHVLSAAGVTEAPMWVTSAVSVLPVAVVGMTAALIHTANNHEADKPKEVK